MTNPTKLAPTLLVVLAACGGVTAPVVSNPAALSVPSVPAEQNPDVIWVTRNVEVTAVDGANKEKRTLGALFACYRAAIDKPGAPQCYLAKYAWTPTDLEWPGPIVMTKDGHVQGGVAPPSDTRQ